MANEIVKAFDPAQLEDHYDAIVIGSGIGGLISANYLANAGVKTLLIEQHILVGGYFHGGWHNGYYFDYGTQSHEILGAILPAMQHLKIDHRVKFKKCTHSFVSESGLKLKMGTLETAHHAFSSAFPESANNIEEYFNYYGDVYSVAKELNMEGMRGLINSNTKEFMPHYSDYWKSKSYYEKMMEYDSIISCRKARQLLDRSRVGKILSHFGYRNQSALATGIFWHLWQDDYFYTENGNQDLANVLGSHFMEKGGTLAIDTSAVEILTTDNAITGVRLGNNKIINSDFIVCNTDLLYALEVLLKGHPLIYDLMQQAKQVPTSEAFFSAYLGTSIPVDELSEILSDSHHTWFFPDQEISDPFDLNFHRTLPLEISAPILQNPDLAKKGSQVVLQCFSNAAWMDYWKISRSGAHSREYRDLKKLVGQQLIENASRYIPDFQKRIDFKMYGSPLTHKRYTNNYCGATAGWTWNPKRTLVSLTEQKITSPFKNLYFAGHWVLYPGGLLTATIAGKIAADQIINS